MIAPPGIAQQDITPVIVSKAKLSEVIEEVPLTGTVVSLRVAQLSTEIRGLVEYFKVEISDQVKKGDENLVPTIQAELGLRLIGMVTKYLTKTLTEPEQ